MKTMCCPPGYHHNGFVATHALGHMMYLSIYLSIYLYIYIYISVCMCVSVCLCVSVCVSNNLYTETTKTTTTENNR